MKEEGNPPFELHSPRNPTGAGRSIREGKHQPWDGRKPAWGYTCWEKPCFGPLVVAAIKIDFVGTALTSKLSEHICSQVISDFGPEHKCALTAYWSKPFPQTCSSHHHFPPPWCASVVPIEDFRSEPAVGGFAKLNPFCPVPTGAWLRGGEEKICSRPCKKNICIYIFTNLRKKIRVHGACSKATRLFLTT